MKLSHRLLRKRSFQPLNKLISGQVNILLTVGLYDLKMDTTSDPKILFVQNLAMDASKTILSFDIIR